jgi:hypothetical protein
VAIVNGITKIGDVVSTAFAPTIDIPVDGSGIRWEVRRTKHLLGDATPFPCPNFARGETIGYTAEKREQMNFRIRKDETGKRLVQ